MGNGRGVPEEPVLDEDQLRTSMSKLRRNTTVNLGCNERQTLRRQAQKLWILGITGSK
jgi:hypothetical protein